jgi:hypothetical protein
MPNRVRAADDHENERASNRGEIPSTKSQIPNKFELPNSKDPNGRAAVVAEAEGMKTAAASHSVSAGPARLEFRSFEFGACLEFGACDLGF